MTQQLFYNLPLRFVAHMSTTTRHIALYSHDATGVKIQMTTKVKANGDFGKECKQYYYNGKWYSERKFSDEILEKL